MGIEWVGTCEISLTLSFVLSKRKTHPVEERNLNEITANDLSVPEIVSFRRGIVVIKKLARNLILCKMYNINVKLAKSLEY